jgi:hypothetical protein
MKQLDRFISEYFLLQELGGATQANPQEAAQRARELQEQQKQAAAGENSDVDAADDTPPAPEPDRPAGASNQEVSGEGLHGNNSSSSGDSSATADPENPFSDAGARTADRSLEQQIGNGYTTSLVDGKRVVQDKDGNVISDPSKLPEAQRTLVESIAAGDARVSELQADPGSSDASVEDSTQVERAVTEPTGSSGTGTEGDASTGDNANPTETAEPTAEVAMKTVADTDKIPDGQKIITNTENPDSFYVTSHGDGKFDECTDKTCSTGGNLGFNDLSPAGQNAVTQFALDNNLTKEIPDPSATAEPAVPKPAEAATDTDPAIAQPKESVELARANKLTSEDGTATVIRRGDGVEGDPSHDNAEARNYLLDGQLDSEKNTFSTFEIDGEKYIGFHSDGYGEGDVRQGVAKLSELDGKNLGADGWKPLSSLGGNAAKIGEALKSAHAARKAEIAKFGGIDGYNQGEKIRETVARLQSHSTSKEGESYKVNGEGASAEQIDKLNNIMNRLNNYGEPLAGIQSDLDSLLKEDSSVEGRSLASEVLEQRLNELEGKGYSAGELAPLKEKLDLATTLDGDAELAQLKELNEEVDTAINTKRDAAHKLSEVEADKFNETLAELKSRKASLNPQQQAMVDRLEKMAQNGGLDKMGKYLQTELNNLSAKAPKPQPKSEGTRGDGDAVDLTKGSGQAFRNSFVDSYTTGEDGKKLEGDALKNAEKQAEADFKKIFGDNDKLSGVIKDFDSLSDIGKKGFIKDLRALSEKDGPSPEDKIKALKTQSEEDKTKSDEAAKKIQDQISKLEEAIKSDKTSEDDKAKARESLDKAKKLEEKLTKAITAKQKSYSQRAELLKNYSKDKEGALYRSVGEDKVTKLSNGEVGTLKDGEFKKSKAEINPELNKVLEQMGIPEEQREKWAQGGTISFSADDCGACPKGDQKNSLLAQTELNGKPYKMFNVEDKDNLTQAQDALMAIFDESARAFPTSFTIDASGKIKSVGNHWQK